MNNIWQPWLKNIYQNLNNFFKSIFKIYKRKIENNTEKKINIINPQVISIIAYKQQIISKFHIQ